ncbi:HAMP domain-containing protein [Donghicola sp. C2-DW-16]|uniref:HAMP domain-containing protein n=1 Tax=Donghicola mangrovi TaxID=2729614 RepID=A0ABX2PIE6_9RHOB|nr:adenylate/guanylate cyclase domain-containing protein [Donghicola mangrovi]NVO29293.1 HAMP domain-containing protein [Donghicola mangrovi]
MLLREIPLRKSVRGRLILAFLGITGLSLLAGGAGFHSLTQVNDALNRITEESTPRAMALLAVSTQAERILNAAPALLVVRSEQARQDVSKSVRAEMELLENSLQDAGIDNTRVIGLAEDGVLDLAKQLDGNLTALDGLVLKRIAISSKREDLSHDLQAVSNGALRLIAPAERKLGAQLGAWDRSGASSADALDQSQGQIAQGIIELLPQQDLATLIANVTSTLGTINTAASVEEVDVLSFTLTTALTELEKANGQMPAQLQSRLTRVLGAMHGLAEGDDGIPAVRRSELEIVASAQDLLKKNAFISGQLSNRIGQLVSDAEAQIEEARAHATEVQRLSIQIMIAAGILSLVTSVLVIWLYVGRVLIRRLTSLSGSMLAIADGNLETKLPDPGIDDEIGRMADALKIFRDTAVEVRNSNLREIETARRRLTDAIENSSEGFAFYDRVGNLVICNSRYASLLFPNDEFQITPGTAFRTVMEESAATGNIPAAEGRAEAWIEEQMDLHRNPGEPRLQANANGQWILISERKTRDGGTVAIYSDISDLKSRETELSEKSTALESLSQQLSKYLSPQIYDSIFSGRQEVKLASQRKRLTVFFSDLVGFTATTERLESEDLTRLLNEYLSEMSDIAMAHGATIDKFIGDAIVIFFGDPDTHGVKEDATRCVKMAVAMQKRMKELEKRWQANGLEEPLQCRIGINTGMCTVGNFGSNERMDYTIIGSGVNLAARLEGACRPGKILLSYETYAHVKDVIACEERGKINVKGISEPVSTFEVIDLHDNLDAAVRPIQAFLPYFQLDLDAAKLTPEDRRAALAVLKEAADRLSEGVSGGSLVPCE